MVLRLFIGPFLASLSIILFLLVILFIANYRNEILGRDISGWIFFKLFFFAAGRMVITAMPIGIVTAALMTYGSLGEHHELAAIKASGVSLLKAMRFAIILGISLTVLSMWAAFEIFPQSNLKFFALLHDVKQKKPEMAIVPGYFYDGLDDYIIRVSGNDPDKGRLYDVMVYNHSERRGNVDLIIADSARARILGHNQWLEMVLYSGTRNQEFKEEERKKYPLGRMEFDSLQYRFKMEGFGLGNTDESQFKHQIILRRAGLITALDSLKDNYRNSSKKYIKQIARYTQIDSGFTSYQPDSLAATSLMADKYFLPGDNVLDCFRDDDKVNPSELLNRAVTDIRAVRSYISFMQRQQAGDSKLIRRYAYEFYSRHTLPINCIIFMVMGASLGAIVRRGGLGFPAIISVIFFVSYYVLVTQGRKLSQEDVISPLMGAAFPLFFFIPIAIIVSIQATLDAKVFSESFWSTEKLRLAIAKGRGRMGNFMSSRFRKSATSPDKNTTDNTS